MNAKRVGSKAETDLPPTKEKEVEVNAEEVTLEERLRRLDTIVGSLEGGEIDLERGLALFEEGVRHIRSAESLLSRAELRVEELIGEVEGLSTKEWTDGEGGER